MSGSLIACVRMLRNLIGSVDGSRRLKFGDHSLTKKKIYIISIFAQFAQQAYLNIYIYISITCDTISNLQRRLASFAYEILLNLVLGCGQATKDPNI